jgi:outer membrane protein assembly factor BamB
MSMKLALFAVLVGSAACGPIPADQADAFRAVPRGDLGRPVMSLRWKKITSDRSREVRPQEFGSAVVYRDHVYAPSAGGWMYAMRLSDGRLRWKKKIGAVDSQPAVEAGNLYVGTDDGILLCLDAQTGREIWRYTTRGPILRQPVIVDLPGGKPGANAAALVVFSNEADQVYALDAVTGEFKWQYKAETPEEYTLRGHAGVAVAGGLVYSGFANGTMVALRLENGSVAWLTSIKGDADRFVDVDSTPAVIDDTVYVTSSSGGVWSLDAATGLVRWRTALDVSGNDGSTGSLITDGERLYVGVADVGIHALDLDGNVLWRQGTRGGGEPGDMVASGDYLFYTLADAGLFVANRATGETYQYFDPGDGVSAKPVISTDDQMFVLSNRGVFYAMDLHRF